MPCVITLNTIYWGLYIVSARVLSRVGNELALLRYFFAQMLLKIAAAGKVGTVIGQKQNHIVGIRENCGELFGKVISMYGCNDHAGEFAINMVGMAEL